MENRYHTPLIPIPCHLPYQVTLYHTIWPHTIPSGVSGVLFTKYEKYFCRLQYLSIRLHLLWTGSSDFCCHFKLQVEAIGWMWSFQNQLNWVLSQVSAIYTLDNPSQATWNWISCQAIWLAQYSSQINQYCIHHNGMAYENQRKQDICVLAVSHEQCKTLSIAMVGALEPNYYPRQACILHIEHVQDRPSKNLTFRIPTCLWLSRWIYQLVMWGILNPWTQPGQEFKFQGLPKFPYLTGS